MVVLTEDTKSGYILIKAICSILNCNIKVFNSSYGDKNNSGNNTKLRQSLVKLWESKLITKGEKVLVIYDKLIPVNSRMISDRNALDIHIDKCISFANMHHFYLLTSDITSIEEVILSFDFLYDWCNINNRIIDSDVKTVLNKLRGARHRIPSEAYLKLLKLSRFSGMTVENMLKTTLQNVTSNENFNNFKIGSDLGICWLNNCDEARNKLSSKQRVLCAKCKCNRMRLGVDLRLCNNRLLILYKYSILKNTLDLLNKHAGI